MFNTLFFVQSHASLRIWFRGIVMSSVVFLRYVLNFFLILGVVFLLSSKYFFVLFLIDLQHHWKLVFFFFLVVLSWLAIYFKTYHIINSSAIWFIFVLISFFLFLSHRGFPCFPPFVLSELVWLQLATSSFPAVSSGFLLGLGYILFPFSLGKDW